MTDRNQANMITPAPHEPASHGGEASLTPELTLNDANAALRRQPFSVMLNARITDFEPGRVVLVVPVADSLLQQHGYVHGGVVAYAVDNALTFAAGSILGPAVLTSNISVEYVAPCAGDIEAVAWVAASTKRSATCRCEITVDGTVCAVGQGSVRSAGRRVEPGNQHSEHA
jgi:uncharacterized protein (TIGR00369 family)